MDLPLAPRASELTAPAADQPTVAPERLAGLKVLLLDDSLDLLELCAAVLWSNGAEVKTAESVAQAMKTLQTFRPHVILADIGMPDEDGYRFIEKLRALSAEEGGCVPAVAWTGHAREQDRRRTLQAGYQIHLAKPTDPGEIVRVVAELAGR
jgi:CheY-like chemotaxis protein